MPLGVARGLRAAGGAEGDEAMDDVRRRREGCEQGGEQGGYDVHCL